MKGWSDLMNVMLKKLTGGRICYLSLSSFILSSSRSFSSLLWASASISSLSIFISRSLSSSWVLPSRSSLYLESTKTAFKKSKRIQFLLVDLFFLFFVVLFLLCIKADNAVSICLYLVSSSLCWASRLRLLLLN